MGAHIELLDDIFNAGAYLKDHPGPLDIDLLKVKLTQDFDGNITTPFYPGSGGAISGVIKRVEIETAIGDGVKILGSCQGLTFGQDGPDGAGGFIHAEEKRGNVHQDMVQVQGGKNVRILNIQMYALTEGGASHAVFMNGPDDPAKVENVVFDRCLMVCKTTGVMANFLVKNCLRSGLRDCHVTPRSEAEKHAISFADTSLEHVDEGNVILPVDYPRVFTMPANDYCFIWGLVEKEGPNKGEPLKWGGSYPGWDEFSKWLTAHGLSRTRWIDRHQIAANCIGATK